MYNLLKNILSKLVSKKVIFEQEEKIRSWFSVFYQGNQYQCNLCEKKLRKFIQLKNGDHLCPNCGSIERNRRLWSLLNAEFLKPDISVLDFSPSRCLYRKLKKFNGIDYQSTDLSGDFIADHQYNITHLDIKTNSLDLVICYHILEHVTEDTLAMKELFRVLKPGGKALVQTPFKEGDIYENHTITTKEERLKHFGQEDHVRIYSISGLKQRLENSGFMVEIRTDFIENKVNKFNPKESLLIISKPLNK